MAGTLADPTVIRHDGAFYLRDSEEFDTEELRMLQAESQTAEDRDHPIATLHIKYEALQS